MIAISARKGVFVIAASVLMMLHAEISIGDVPVAVDVVTREEIELRGTQDVSDFLSSAPGITFDSGSGPRSSRISIRGIGNNAGNVLINGTQSTSMFGPSGNYIGPGSFPLFDLERVEVLRGPQGTLFGRNTTAGVINIVPRDDRPTTGTHGSYTLDEVQNTLNGYNFALQSPKDCDATHGTPQPSWSLFSKHDYGMPKWSPDLGSMFFGSMQDGYPAAAEKEVAPPDDAPASDGGSESAPDSDPASTPSGGPQYPVDPFERYPYPADYMFDFESCPEKKKHALELIAERDKAGAEAIVLADRFRGPGRTADEVAADRQARKDFWALRRAKNEELREYWHGCDDTESGSGEAEDTSTASASRSSGRSSMFGDDFSLDFSVRYSTRNEDDSVGSEPAPNIGIDVSRYDLGARFGLPFGSGSFRDIESFSSEGGSRVYTDSQGRAGVQVSDGIMQYLTGSNSWPDYYRGQGSPGGSSASEDTASSGDPWQLRFDRPTGDSLPGIGLQFNYEPIDGAVQKFSSPGAGKGIESIFDGQQLSETFGGNIPFTIGKGFSVGSDWYVPYSWREVDGFDPSFFSSIDGQRGWTNDFCGDEAQAAEEVGYTLSQFSPVQSVDDQWALQNVGLKKGGTALSQSAQPVVVAVIDTGLDWNHADFSWDNIWRNDDEVPGNGIDDDENGYIDDVIGWDFMADHNRPWDNDGHGTFVAGVIAATQNNDIGIDGINSNARIMVLKALNNFGRTRASYLARAIAYAADNGANIINLSVSGPGFPTVVQDAVNYANEKGVLVIQAAGNVSDSVDNAIPVPLEGTMIIGASGSNKERAGFSNFGMRLSLAAPGIDIVSLRARRTDFMYNSGESSYPREDGFMGDDRRYYRSTGTSFSAAIVSGIASLAWSERPELTNEEVRRMLEQSASDIGDPGRDQHSGFGIVDAAAALKADPAFFVDAFIDGVLPVESGEGMIIAVAGRANADQFKSAKLEIGASEDPIEWTQVGDAITEPATGGLLGSFSAENVRGARVWMVRVVVEHANGETREHRHKLELR